MPSFAFRQMVLNHSRALHVMEGWIRGYMRRNERQTAWLLPELPEEGPIHGIVDTSLYRG